MPPPSRCLSCSSQVLMMFAPEIVQSIVQSGLCNPLRLCNVMWLVGCRAAASHSCPCLRAPGAEELLCCCRPGCGALGRRVQCTRGCERFLSDGRAPRRSERAPRTPRIACWLPPPSSCSCGMWPLLRCCDMLCALHQAAGQHLQPRCSLHEECIERRRCTMRHRLSPC